MRVSQFILNFVLNSAWQILVIFAVAKLVSWLLRNGPARYRHTLWVVVMLASLLVPLLTATRFVPDVISSFQVDAPPIPIQTKATQAPAASEDLTVNHISPSRHKTFSLRTRDILLLTFIYALFISVRGIRLARFWRRQQKLRRSATDIGVTSEIEAVMQRCRRLLEISKVSIGLSKQARVPSLSLIHI